MFSSFFPNPKIFFPAAILWTAIWTAIAAPLASAAGYGKPTRPPRLSWGPRSRAMPYQSAMLRAVHRTVAGKKIRGFGKNDENIVHQ